MGFEPTTFSLARRRSTAEPRPRTWPFRLAESAESQNRTGDTAIFSRVLYQLSYLGLKLKLQSQSTPIVPICKMIVKQGDLRWC